MKFTTILAATATLFTSSSRRPLEEAVAPRQVTAQEFDVSEFSAGCVPHGTQCSIGFKVATNQQPYQTSCTFTGQPLGSSSIPDVGFTSCADPSIAWSFRRVTVGSATPFYELTLVTAEQKLAAAKFFPASDFPLVNAGSSFYQTFKGDGRFVVA